MMQSENSLAQVRASVVKRNGHVITFDIKGHELEWHIQESTSGYVWPDVGGIMIVYVRLDLVLPQIVGVNTTGIDPRWKDWYAHLK